MNHLIPSAYSDTALPSRNKPPGQPGFILVIVIWAILTKSRRG